MVLDFYLRFDLLVSLFANVNVLVLGRTFDFIDDDNDEEKSRALRHDRRKIRTPFCDDNAVQFVVSASSSEKAETSDIFTVSSDSYLDTDVNNDTVTTVKSRLSADSRSSIEDEGSMSDETTVNNESNWHCRSSLRRKIVCFFPFILINVNTIT